MTTHKQNVRTVRKIALSFPETMEEPHFEKPSFRVLKKIFATVDLKNNRLCVKLSVQKQDLFTLFDKTIIYPVPNKWGTQGWTFVELNKVNHTLLKDILLEAFCTVAPLKLSSLVNNTLSS
jgi:hypothetical protein